MARRLFAPHAVAVTGSAIGLLSLAAGWLTIRPNRLASGTSLSLWAGFGWQLAAVIAALWLACFLLSFAGNRRRYVIGLGLALNLAVILTFLFCGSSATRLLGGASSLSRVSFGAGVWISSLGAYIAIFSCRQRLAGSPVWRNLVSWSALLGVASLLASGWLNNLSVIVEFRNQQAQFASQLLTHVILFAGTVFVGTLIGIPLGIWASRSRSAEKPVFFITNIVQTVPTLALFGILIAPLSALSLAFPVLKQVGISGIGAAPAIIALILYSLLPVVRNTYVGIRQIDPSMTDAARGMGMSRGQIFRRIEVPLSARLVTEGIRTAAVQAVGNTALAALIGAGGLGYFIFQGISQAANDLVILGAVPILALALVVDLGMRGLVRIATPRGVVPA